jgi:hypothetical protein
MAPSLSKSISEIHFEAQGIHLVTEMQAHYRKDRAQKTLTYQSCQEHSNVKVLMILCIFSWAPSPKQNRCHPRVHNSHVSLFDGDIPGHNMKVELSLLDVGLRHISRLYLFLIVTQWVQTHRLYYLFMILP